MHRAELVEHEIPEGDEFLRTEKRWQEPILGTTEVKNQHYIPQMYLRGFARGDQVRMVDLGTGKDSIRTNVRNAGAQRGFNNFRIDEFEVSTENWLSELEAAADPFLKRLRADPSQLLRFTFDEEMDLARFLAALSLRVPAFRGFLDSLQSHLLEKIKPIARAYLEHQHKGDDETINRIWADWEQQPPEWWLQQEHPFDHAEDTAKMLEGVQGFTNMLWSMPWRIGRVPERIRLYTSDNPMHGYLQPIREWWEHGSFATFWYYVPLSPSVLLRLSPFTYRPEEAEVGDPGERAVRDFSGWDAAMAMHVQSRGATQYLYGDGPYIAKDEAANGLSMLELSVVTTCKVELNWSGDEPPTTTFPDGRETTPVRVGPLQKELARMRKLIHERRR